MISVNEAYKIVLKENPKMETNTCNEYTDKYVFSLRPKGCVEGFANSAVYIVDKNTGDYSVAPFWEVINEPVVKNIDIAKLSG